MNRILAYIIGTVFVIVFIIVRVETNPNKTLKLRFINEWWKDVVLSVFILGIYVHIINMVFI